MTGKERLTAALKCKPTDRVPVSCYELDIANLSNSWERRMPSYNRLMKFIGDNCDLFVPVTAEYTDPFLARNEMIEAKRKDGSLFMNITWKTPKGDIKQFKRYDVDKNNSWVLEPFVKSDSDIEKLLSIGHAVEKLNSKNLLEKESLTGDAGILLIGFVDPVCIVADYFDYADFIMRITTGFDKVKPLLDAKHELCTAVAKEIIKSLKGKNVAVRLVGPKLVAPPNVSPDVFREVVSKYDKTYVKMFNEAGIPVRIHCQGKVAKIFDQLLGLEAAALDPMEPIPQGDLSLREAKTLCAGKMCLCGGIESTLLEKGTPDQIEFAVKECMDQAKEGYGYIILPSGSPLDSELSPKVEANYMAFIEASIKYGKY